MITTQVNYQDYKEILNTEQEMEQCIVVTSELTVLQLICGIQLCFGILTLYYYNKHNKQQSRSVNDKIDQINTIMTSQYRNPVKYSDNSIQTDTYIASFDSSIIQEYILLSRRYQQLFESSTAKQQIEQRSVNTQVTYCDLLVNCSTEVQIQQIQESQQQHFSFSGMNALKESLGANQTLHKAQYRPRTQSHNLMYANVNNDLLESLVLSEYIEESEI